MTRADVRRVLETIAERGAPIEANRTLAVIRKVYNWAIGEDLLEVNPAYRIPAPGTEHKRDRVLTHDEIRAIWKDLDNEEPRIAAVMRLRLLTGQRGGEIASMERGELDLEERLVDNPGREGEERCPTPRAPHGSGRQNHRGTTSGCGGDALPLPYPAKGRFRTRHQGESRLGD